MAYTERCRLSNFKYTTTVQEEALRFIGWGRLVLDLQTNHWGYAGNYRQSLVVSLSPNPRKAWLQRWLRKQTQTLLECWHCDLVTPEAMPQSLGHLLMAACTQAMNNLPRD